MKSPTHTCLSLLVVLWFVTAAASAAAPNDEPVDQSPAAPTRRSIPQANLQIPEAMQSCAANLEKISAAIKAYEKEKGEPPPWLSDLVPEHLSKESLLCPVHQTPKAGSCPDPRLPCSYSYQLSSTPAPSEFGPIGGMPYKQWKAQQIQFFGNVVPIVRCAHGTYRLNLSAAGQVFWSGGAWEPLFMPAYRRGVELVSREEPVADRPVDIYALPSGRAAADVSSLLKFIQNLRSYRPQTEWEAAEYQRRAPSALMLVARRILSIEKDEWSEAFQTALVVLLEDRVRIIAEAGLAQQQEVLDQVQAFLKAKAERGLQSQDVELAVATATALESSGNLELATRAYSDFAKLSAQSKDEKVASMAEVFEGAVRRLSLPGQAIELEGARMDGSEFDGNAYRGKIVLVYFWASDSAACRAELSSVKLNYELYHDRGLEVLGISVDRDRQLLAEFLRQEEIPWDTLRGEDPEAVNPAVKYYGVTELPTALLIDKEGNVASVHAHGGNLDMLLEKLLGPPYVPSGELSYVDLSPKANLTLTADFDSLQRNNNLANLPRGEQTFGGVKFKVGERLVHLGQTHRPDFPGNVEGIAVNQTLAKLYFLHGAQWGSVADGTQIGEYRVHYDDGTMQSIPIVIGQDVRDWWNMDGAKAVTRGKVVWVGENEASQVNARQLRLYISVWSNSHPDRLIRSIDFVESPGGNAGPFCVAITAEAGGGSAAGP